MIEGATADAVDIFITPDAPVAAAAVIVDFGSSVCERANASEIDLETRPKAASLPDEQTRRIKEYHVLHEGDGAEKSAIAWSLLA